MKRWLQRLRCALCSKSRSASGYRPLVRTLCHARTRSRSHNSKERFRGVRMMIVKEIWRYPVKSMAGERLAEALLHDMGIRGDRLLHVEDAHGRWITARSYPQLLGFHARMNGDGVPLVDQLPWSSEQIQWEVESVVGPGARLICSTSAERFDVLPLLVASDGAIAAFGYDGRRLRPNIVIAGVHGLGERTWEGRRLRVGAVTLRLEKLRARCVMTTFDPDTLEQDRGVLASIVERFDGTLA